LKQRIGSPDEAKRNPGKLFNVARMKRSEIRGSCLM
jgi:hypothetical protein